MDDRARIELASTLLCRQPPCQPAPYRLAAPPGFDSGHLHVQSVALCQMSQGGNEMVCVAGFEPAISDFQGRRGRPGSPTHRWRSREESNPHLRFRRPASYPFDYESNWRCQPDSNRRLPG